ncbi:MAG: hypothetical protein GX613_12535 [Chloroflexi bacterium]|jgi:hypothetical protein|nr:hypothetical protein [Chloroflexota bacterium]
MASENSEKINTMRQLRDMKVREHFEQYAPVWLVDEEPLVEDETLRFNVVFVHPRYGWVTRRYRFDAFNNVLYYHGQRRLREEDTLDLLDQEPYTPAETINTVESYGG